MRRAAEGALTPAPCGLFAVHKAAACAMARIDYTAHCYFFAAK
jgi:hypothetical protein